MREEFICGLLFLSFVWLSGKKFLGEQKKNLNIRRIWRKDNTVPYLTLPSGTGISNGRSASNLFSSFFYSRYGRSRCILHMQESHKGKERLFPVVMRLSLGGILARMKM